jgi:flagellum-specific ATP synthase
MESVFSKYVDAAEEVDPLRFCGRVTRVNGLLIESIGPKAVVGEICHIDIPSRGREIPAEVTGFSGEIVRLMPYDAVDGIEPGAAVKASGARLSVRVGMGMLGRVLGPVGTPIDNKGPLEGNTESRSVFETSTAAMDRPEINERFITGLRAVDGLLTVGKGQRLAVFGGSGVGKSTFQGMLARNTSADVNVIALIGERGKELNEFINDSLGEEGMRRSVIVVATSDQSDVAKVRASYTATTIAEYFRDEGLDVMFLFDNIYRFAESQRLIGLSNGEPQTRRGYPPSVFQDMHRLLERAGKNERGSITAFYASLVEGGDMDEPISDHVRATVDGHIILSRALFNRHHYPAIDILPSISRNADKVTGEAIQKAAGIVRQLMAAYNENELLINTGAYKKGTNPQIDAAIDAHEKIETFLIQGKYEKSAWEDTIKALAEIAGVEVPDTELNG